MSEQIVSSFGYLGLTEVLQRLYGFGGFAAFQSVLITNNESQEGL